MSYFKINPTSKKSIKALQSQLGSTDKDEVKYIIQFSRNNNEKILIPGLLSLAQRKAVRTSI